MTFKKKNEYFLGFAATIFTLIIYSLSPGFIKDLELLYQNAQFHWRGPDTPGKDIVIASVDEKSLDKLGRWPWSRDVFARIVDNLTAMGARVIAFDMVFSGEDNSGGLPGFLKLKDKLGQKGIKDSSVLSILDESIESADRDNLFATAIKNSRRVVLGYFFHFDPSTLSHLSRKELDQNFKNIKSTRFRGFIKSDQSIDPSDFNILQAYAVESNLDELSKNTRHAGFFSFDVETDGTLRRQPLLVQYHDADSGRDFFFPSLAVKSVEKFFKGTMLFKVGPAGVEKVLIDAKEPIVIPTNSKGEIMINFLGPQGSFPYISLADIYAPREGGLDSGIFKDKIVLVGATATALKDIRLTPFDPVFPGVEIHGTIIDNILNGKSLYRPAWLDLAEPGFLFVWGVFLTILFSLAKPVWGLGLWMALNFGYFCIVQWFFVSERFFLFGTLPMLQSLVILSLMVAYQYLVEQNQKRFIRGVFDQYVSPEVIDRLISNPDNMKLGGEEKELTSYFTDLAGFTSFSEKMTAEAQVKFLNEYLGEMSDILLKHEGTLDKYDGDAIKAFFGAPVYFSNHAEKACMVAIAMQKRLEELNHEWKEKELPELKMRIGINTGMIVVGNLGSKTRMSYGMNGDAVNLAARLEGANKFYGTWTMIAESTYLQAKDAIEAREMDYIQVVGRKKPVKIFELIGVKGCLEEDKKEMIKFYEKGLALYKEGEWEKAIILFKKALEIDPDDGPSKILIARCHELEQSPPEEQWQGVYTLSSK
ncbi:MAG: CHASE2 domain-containing protein [Candidatus Nitronauta litoralis]|uniref:CHASE2 domain-containing protein n=1 Tax=Candidatus Nitronauta litoralis TaxID=2705533 RepID=A0A7T0BWN1_9BACT|nr:MAG: CHASE2 domain-containing protein [Candidatus Nitronauta litoralis]